MDELTPGGTPRSFPAQPNRTKPDVDMSFATELEVLLEDIRNLIANR